MIRSQSAYTSEIDDVKAAVDDVLGQLDLEGGLLKNSVGIISCYYEFVETGVVNELSRRLPFDVIGCTTMGSAVNAHGGAEQLSLIILTSDDVIFSSSFSEPISFDDMEAPITNAYKQARDKLPGEPELILVMAPIMTDANGVEMLKIIDKASGGRPAFGTLSNDYTPSYENSRTFLNGEAHRHKMVLLLMHGAVKPKFFVTSLPDENIGKQKGVITKSDGCVLHEVDGKPLFQYLATLGMKREDIEAVSSVPFMIDYGDGAKPTALNMYAFTPEGHALCGGETPVGATLKIGKVDYKGIMKTAEDTVQRALGESGAGAIIAFPCFMRLLMITPNSEDELEKSRVLIGDSVPFLLCYSGGEICPVYDDNGEQFNRFHNLTYTIGVL
ncbi:hypothetical protein FACS1894205_5630 [Alphaproteobacteria bacterium]|nr:hypothetical protein FACS1894205_5630 [Alphaproteobacteria bacterium]